MIDKLIDKTLHKLANIVVSTCSNSTRISLGLLKGKLGVVIFLLHYAKYYNKDKYEVYATDLLEYIIDNSIIHNSRNVIIDNLIDIGIVTNYMDSQELVTGDLNNFLEEIDSFLLIYLNNKNSLYLTYQELTTIGKYYLLRIESELSSANHLHHIKAIEKIVKLLKLHIINTSICNPAIVKFLYLSSKVLSDKSIESLLIQQLNNYPNRKEWYRSSIPNWFGSFFIPEDNEPLKNIIIKEIEEHSRKYLDNDWSDALESGTAGLIVWMNLISDYLLEDKYINIKDMAIKKIVSNINQYKVLTDISIYRGCSGIGLALLSCLDSKCTTQWIKLL